MEDKFIRAQMYDRMINWDRRLAREIPVISDYFADLGESIKIFDVCCSSGRHSLALNQKGFHTMGVDISEPFIDLARQLAEEHNQGEMQGYANFWNGDAATDELLEKLKGQYFDGAILLGNAIANMGNYTKGKALIKNIFVMLRPGGKFFVQTVNRPYKPWYNPLRDKDGLIIQRIMVPDPKSDELEEEHEHNVILHVNQIDPQKLEYVEQSADNKFFMYRLHEFRDLVTSIGFEVNSISSGYAGNEVEDKDGETLIWKLVKPEIPLTDDGIALFEKYAKIGPQEIRKRTLKIWQDMMQAGWYRCMQSYRFLYPRIMAHPRYTALVAEKKDTPILDLACNVGTDLRQLYVDGARQLMGVEREKTFVDAGYELYGDRDTAEMSFVIADILADSFLDLSSESPKGEFSTYTNHFGMIHAGSLIHLLEEDESQALAERVYALLDEDGIFFGRTVGSQTAGRRENGLRFLHSKETLRSLLNDVGFEEVEVIDMPRGGPIGESTNATVLQLGFYARK